MVEGVRQGHDLYSSFQAYHSLSLFAKATSSFVVCYDRSAVHMPLTIFPWTPPSRHISTLLKKVAALFTQLFLFNVRITHIGWKPCTRDDNGLGG
jgi:hypothetical protein